MRAMKGIIVIWLLATVAGCNDASDSADGATQRTGTGSGSGKTTVARDMQINKTNSYSDLFIDSTTVESFIKKQKLNDTLATDMRAFYNARNFQFAWFSSDGLTEQAFAFRNLYDYSKDDKEKKKVLDSRLDSLMLEDSLLMLPVDNDIAKTELLLTWRFIQYMWDEYPDEKARTNMLLQFVPAQKQDILKRAESVLKDDHMAMGDGYNALKKELEKYVTFAQNGGWPSIPVSTKKYKKGSTDTVVSLIKRRMQATGQLSAKDTSAVFTPELENAIKTLQSTYGFTADGIIQPSLIKELNKPVLARVQQLMVNMERMRWRPANPEGRLILVNIPEFMLHVREGKTAVFDMEIIVGKQGHSTVMFSGDLNQVVFSPYWNVPESIVRNEILPSIEKKPNYLEQNDMEITGERGGLPVVRQLPGDKNELGKIKFLFPNSFNIYFHDTPHKGLFQKDQRAYSHGCIRLADAEKMARYLLKDDAEWPPEKIEEAMNSAKEQYVKIKEPVPVLIYYYTAWVDENGVLQFRKDIYAHDDKVARKLFSNSAIAKINP
jgi:L,D-transpeptidase YcbB